MEMEGGTIPEVRENQRMYGPFYLTCRTVHVDLCRYFTLDFGLYLRLRSIVLPVIFNIYIMIGTVLPVLNIYRY
jgi:hypothetical protein